MSDLAAYRRAIAMRARAYLPSSRTVVPIFSFEPTGSRCGPATRGVGGQGAGGAAGPALAPRAAGEPCRPGGLLAVGEGAVGRAEVLDAPLAVLGEDPGVPS